MQCGRREVVKCEAPPLRYHPRILHLLQTRYGSSRHGQPVAGAQRLAEHVSDASFLKNHSRGSSGNHSGAWCGRANLDTSGPRLAYDLVDDRGPRQGNTKELLPRIVRCFVDGNRDLSRLSISYADKPCAVTNNDQCSERETTAAFHDLRNSSDPDNSRFTEVAVY